MRIGKGYFLILTIMSVAGPSGAQGVEAAPEYPQVRVGGTIFADYTYQGQPTGKEQDGDTIRQSSFNGGRETRPMDVRQRNEAAIAGLAEMLARAV